LFKQTLYQPLCRLGLHFCYFVIAKDVDQSHGILQFLMVDNKTLFSVYCHARENISDWTTQKISAFSPLKRHQYQQNYGVITYPYLWFSFNWLNFLQLLQMALQG